MEIVGGKSYDDGIDFVVKEGRKRFIYSARRNSVGDVETSVTNSYTKVHNRSFWEIAWCGIVTLLFVSVILFFRDVENVFLTKLGWVLALAIFWLGLISYLYMQGRDKKNDAFARFHAVEHKVLNFCQEYSYLPRTLDDINQMSALYMGCGSTIIIVIALFSTLAMLSIFMVPTILLKILCVAISAFITMCCWANGKCDFAQKWLLKQPTHQEVELAVCAMHRLAKEQNVL